jgi:arylsulfatase A-like enzyme/outer membrane protein assembly factor BamB
MTTIALATLALTVLCLPARAKPTIPWAEFRGSGGTGVAAESRPPAKLAAPAWKAPVAAGLSAPVIAGGRLFLTAIENGRLVTCAFDVTSGQPLWKQQAPDVPLEKVHAAGSPATSTPLADEGRVYVYFGSFGLLCYDHTGAEQWQKPMPTPQSLYGMATSLIAYRDTLILVLDNDADLPGSRMSQSKVIAVRKSDGGIAWETARPLVRSGWSTPAIWRHHGGEELIVPGSGRLTSYDPQTGAEKWFTPGFSRETIAQPVSGHGRLFASAAMLGGAADEQPDPDPFWKAMLQFDADKDGKVARSEMTRYFTFPLRPELPPEHPGFGIPLPSDETQRKQRQGETFGWMDKDGDDFWTRDEFFANLKFDRGKPRLIAIRPGGTGEVTESQLAWEVNRNIPEIPSPVYWNDRLYLIRSGGLLTCVNAGDGKLLYTERVGAPGQYSASPVIAGDRLYLVSNPGVVSVVKTGDAFELLDQHDLGEPAFVTPAFDEATVFIRTQSHLLAFRAEQDAGEINNAPDAPEKRDQSGYGKLTPAASPSAPAEPGLASRPNVILCMTDDQGWGDVSYNGLTKIRTPNMDAMAAAGLRFNRFYAQQTCSPTRASVMTGRHPNRMGVFRPGMPLRKNETTIAQIMKQAGYATGHFGKWHLNGVAGPGKIMADTDPLAPRNLGFEESFSVTNYFETDWAFGRNGVQEKANGDGSEVIVSEALKFIGAAAEQQRPFFAVVWFGSPHVPHQPLPADLAAAGGSGYYGEILGVDRSLGTLRAGLRNLGIADNTMLWFSSDNGGRLDQKKPDAHGTNADLRGRKGDMWEGGIRVPGIIEWPARLKPAVTDLPAGVMDIFPTLVDLLQIKVARPVPLDGTSLLPLIEGRMKTRPQPIGFWQFAGDQKNLNPNSGPSAWSDNQFKLVKPKADHWELYDIATDRTEQHDIAAGHPDVVERMKAELQDWQQSVMASYHGRDYAGQ